ncbi:L-threonine 3-dehydrogenase [candidate division KSB1 bacterium]|nr:MAG: L-threonine 3-dehydrogenase [candidate division KSB1 bacterium]
MAETMKAVVKNKAGSGAELVETKIPALKSDEVLVKVIATSICGTDVHIYEWNDWAKGRIKNIPQILGHEFAGEVVATGKNVKNIKVGDYISAETHIPCQRCYQCLTGNMHICNNLKILGVDRDGCFAEYVAVPEIVAWKNDKKLLPEFASVQEPLGNAVYCTLVEPVTGKSVLIIGDGPLALFSCGVARAGGAANIFLAGMEEFRMNIGLKMGATEYFNVNKEKVDEIILKKTNGLGVDVVLDMAGGQQALNLALSTIRKGGRFSAFGLASGPVKIDINENVIFKGITVYGINGRLMFDTWFKMANLLNSGKLDITPVVTHKLPLEEFKKGFSLMMNTPKLCGKVVLYPDSKFLK